MNVLSFVMVMWVGIVILVVGLDVLTAYLAEKKTEQARAERLVELTKASALRKLTYAGLHKNAAQIYKKPTGSHRRVRTY